MADIVLGSVGNIIRIGLKIKEALKNVKQNEKECRDIERCVARVTRLIDCFAQTLNRYDEVSSAAIHNDNNMAMHDALEDLAESLEGALDLVTKCQRKHVVRRFIGAGDMAKELRQVQDDILRKVTLGSFATSVVQLGITLMTIAQPAPPPPPQNRSEKDETKLATGSGAPSDPLSGLIHFNLSELEVATHNFAEENLIGSGGYGKVFKGVLRNGLVVAVKDFRCYGNDYVMRNEIKVGAKLEHRNVVRTLGYCIDDKVVSVCHNGREMEATEERRILVIGYLPNGSLGDIISGAQRISWPFCFRIIQGIAQGLHHLHEQNILHLDPKPDNILFDSDMNPVIIDFGISVVLDNDVDTITTDQPVGTLGYLPPEYITNGVVSNKCDVFAFGVILLRTIFQACAKLGFHYYYHRDADSKWDAVLQEDMHKMKELFDPRLVQESELTDVLRCLRPSLAASLPGENSAFSPWINAARRFRPGKLFDPFGRQCPRFNAPPIRAITGENLSRQLRPGSFPRGRG